MEWLWKGRLCAGCVASLLPGALLGVRQLPDMLLAQLPG